MSPSIVVRPFRSIGFSFSGVGRRSSRVLLLLVALFAPFPPLGIALESASAQSAPILDAGFWHTSGTQILDASDNPVRISGVTWYGMDSAHWVPSGLDFQPYTTIMDTVKLLGYNLIRLPLSNELVEKNPAVTAGIAANPDLRGRRALDILDRLLSYAQKIGLKVILDNHRSRAPRPLEVNRLDEALWYTDQYPESSWIHDWQTLALRYRSNDAVIGFDLRNEPHTQGAGPWDLTAYLLRSATWGPFRGIDNAASDWRLAAQRAGNAVLAINPHLLVIVEGLPIYPDFGTQDRITASWWAGLLIAVKVYPVQLQVPHQLVYSVHEWGPRKHPMPWFKNMTYSSLKAVWHRNWSYLLDNPNASYAAPVWLGEFGTCNDSTSCTSSSSAGSQGAWFAMMLRFLREHPEIGWSFFALNGTNSNSCRTNNGLMNAQWNNVASLSLQASLRSVQQTPGLLPRTARGPLIEGAATHRAPRSPSSKLCRIP